MNLAISVGIACRSLHAHMNETVIFLVYGDTGTTASSVVRRSIKADLLVHYNNMNGGKR